MLRSISVAVLFVFLFSYPAFSLETDTRMESKATVIAQALQQAETAMQASTTPPTETAVEVNKDYRQSLEAELKNEPSEDEDLPGEFSNYYRYMPRQGVSENRGTVGITEAASEYTYEFKAFGEKLPLEVGIGAQYVGIDNSTNFSLPRRLTEVTTGIEATLPFFFDKTYLRLGVAPSFFSDNWSFDSIDFKMLGKAYFIYKPSDKLIFVGGVAAFPGFYSSIAPIAGVIYKPDNKWSFNLIPPRPNIDYALTKKLNVFAEYSLTSNEYKVTKDDERNITLQYQEQHAGLGLNYRFNKYIESSVSMGQIFKRNFQYRDSLGKLKIQSGLYSEFKVTVNM